MVVTALLRLSQCTFTRRFVRCDYRHDVCLSPCVFQQHLQWWPLHCMARRKLEECRRIDGASPSHRCWNLALQFRPGLKAEWWLNYTEQLSSRYNGLYSGGTLHHMAAYQCWYHLCHCKARQHPSIRPNVVVCYKFYANGSTCSDIHHHGAGQRCWSRRREEDYRDFDCILHHQPDPGCRDCWRVVCECRLVRLFECFHLRIEVKERHAGHAETVYSQNPFRSTTP